jgi:hypothetical protein
LLFFFYCIFSHNQVKMRVNLFTEFAFLGLFNRLLYRLTFEWVAKPQFSEAFDFVFAVQTHPSDLTFAIFDVGINSLFLPKNCLLELSV